MANHVSIHQMGLMTLIIIAVVVLAIIGLGVGVFFSGVQSGVEKIEEHPAVKNTTTATSQFLANVTSKIVP